MTVPDPSGDVLSNLPIWVQVAASLGMFVVAVLAAVIGFSRRVAPWMFGGGFASSSAALTPIDPARLQHFDDVLSQVNSTLSRIAGALEGMHVVMQDEAREAAIEREVTKRLQEHEAKGARGGQAH